MLEDARLYTYKSRDAQRVGSRATSIDALKVARMNLDRSYLYLVYHNLIQKNTWRDIYNFQKVYYEYTRHEHLERFKP